MGVLDLDGGQFARNVGAAISVESGAVLMADGMGFYSNGGGVLVANGGSATVSGSAFENNAEAVRHDGLDAAQADFQNN